MLNARCRERLPRRSLPKRLTAHCYRRRMSGAQEYDVVCPHCKKSFRGELIGADESRQGFKCPHCRLFVPFERADVEEPG